MLTIIQASLPEYELDIKPIGDRRLFVAPRSMA